MGFPCHVIGWGPKDSAFSFLLCNVVCRLPTTADWSGNLVLGDKVSLPRSHRLSYHVDCCTFCFFALFTFISFWAIFFFFFFKAILVSHKNVTILPNRLWLVFRHLFFYYPCHMDSYDKNYDFFLYNPKIFDNFSTFSQFVEVVDTWNFIYYLYPKFYYSRQ